MAAGQGWNYDAAGNTTGDPEGRTFIYDAENKQVEVRNASSTTVGQYFYDGDGKRVKKFVPSTGETTIFVYDAGGKLVAEYSTIVASTNDAKVNYLTADHLGSPRINTDANGNATARHDYMPFGEEIFGLGDRTTALGYTADTVRKQFTGYERDAETDLDFAQARMYSSKLGRFSQFDPVMVSQSKRVDPQEINPYAYCQNNPLKFTDSSGAILDPSKWSKKAQKEFANYVKQLNKDPVKYADELATIEQLKKSDVNYVVTMVGDSQFNAGTEGGLTPDPENNTISINLSNSRREKFSLFSRFGHEFEHARQFDSGEFAYAYDKNGNLLGRANGDISEEVEAWKVQLKLSQGTDFQVPFAMGDQNVPILNKFAAAKSDMDKAKALSGLSTTYNDGYNRVKDKEVAYGKNFSLSGVPPGTKVDYSKVSPEGRRYFGRTHE